MQSSDATSGFTSRVAHEVVEVRYEDLSPLIVTRAKHVLLDWLGAVLAGSVEPTAGIAQVIASDSLSPSGASVFGTTLRTSPRDAALANAIAAHALDFDDSSLWANAHVSAAVVSATVALGEVRHSTTRQAVEAIVAGMQGQALIALADGPSAYSKGFHGTGIYGTFGAAGAAARLLGLNPEQLQRAYGLAATQAAGLRITFGTMGKHLNAGHAASAGILAAQLAEQGFTAPTDAIEGLEGFAWTHSTTFDPARPEAVMGDHMAIESVLFKRHACCHGTHSTIEGISALRSQHSFDADDVAEVHLEVSTGNLNICCIPEPVTGLEGKFSMRHAASVALAGRTTGPEAFTDESVHDPRLLELRKLVTLDANPDRKAEGPTKVSVTLTNGERYESEVDVFEPSLDSELATEWDALVNKFTLLAAPICGEAVAADLVQRIDRLDPDLTVNELFDLARVGVPTH